VQRLMFQTKEKRGGGRSLQGRVHSHVRGGRHEGDAWQGERNRLSGALKGARRATAKKVNCLRRTMWGQGKKRRANKQGEIRIKRTISISIPCGELRTKLRRVERRKKLAARVGGETR